MCTTMAGRQYCTPIWFPIISVDIRFIWSPVDTDSLTWSFYHNPILGSGRWLLLLPNWVLPSLTRIPSLPRILCMRMMTAVLDFIRNRSVWRPSLKTEDVTDTEGWPLLPRYKGAALAATSSLTRRADKTRIPLNPWTKIALMCSTMWFSG